MRAHYAVEVLRSLDFVLTVIWPVEDGQIESYYYDLSGSDSPLLFVYQFQFNSESFFYKQHLHRVIVKVTA